MPSPPQVVAAAALAVLAAGVVATAIVEPEVRVDAVRVEQASPGVGDCAHGGPRRPLDDPPATPPPAAPDGRTNQLDLQVSSDCDTIRVGQPLHLRITVSGNAATPVITGVGIDGLVSGGSAACAPVDRTERPAPAVTRQDVTHVYRAPKRDRIGVSAATSCSRFSGFDRAELVVEVLP